MYGKTSLADDLQRQVRLDKAKEQAVFNVIHILADHYHSLILSDAQIVEALLEKNEVKTRAEGWQWLKRYIGQQLIDEDKRHLKKVASLSGRQENARRMENRK